MKKIFTSTLLFFLLTFTIFAQAPAGYYSAAEGKTGAALKTALSSIIATSTSVSYSGLWTAYSTTDKKANGKVWDMYSDIPDGTPPYEFTFSTDQCGTYSN